MGMMAEICMKGRMILDRVSKGDCSQEQAVTGLDRLEAEMDECMEKFERLSR